jgi:hypothetical protein
MKNFLLSVIMLFTTVLVVGQAREGKVSYQRNQQPAAMIELPYSNSVVENALNNYLSSKGAKGSDSRGFRVYKNVRWSDTLTNDLYFKIDRKSGSESTVYLVVAAPNENLSSRSSENNYAMEEAKQLLNNLVPTAEASNIDMQIKQQEETVSKAEKRLRNLMDDGSDLNKRRISIEEKINDNRQEQDRQKIEIEKQKQALSTLLNKKRS